MRVLGVRKPHFRWGQQGAQLGPTAPLGLPGRAWTEQEMPAAWSANENSPRSLDKPPLRELPPSRWIRSQLGTRAAADEPWHGLSPLSFGNNANAGLITFGRPATDTPSGPIEG
jgi:hypothetical protein